MNVILYSTGCSNCRMLEAKLKAKKIEYVEVTDSNIILGMGFMSVPMLEVDGKIMNYKNAIEWLNNLEGEAV